MADNDLPEAAPSGGGRGKQIVFLFMSAVVIAVVIFLLGVSVGRGVRKAAVPPDGGDPGDTTLAPSSPARTAPTVLNEHDTLPAATAGRGDAGQATAPATTAPTTAAPPPPVSEVPPARPRSDVSGSASKAPSSASTKGPSRGGEYSLQVGAFTTMSAAQSLLAQVKSRDKSYPASIVTLPPSEPGRYRVMVGPFPTADEANQVKARLKKDKFDAILKR